MISELRADAVHSSLDQPLLSVGIPTWNRCRSLRESMALVIAQAEEHGLQDEVEIVIGDNASDDDTEIVVAELSAGTSLRIRYERHPENLGAARNALSTLRHATGKYWAFAGDDDLLVPGALPKMIHALTEHGDCTLLMYKQAERATFDPALAFTEPFAMTLEEVARRYFYYLGNAGLLAVDRALALGELERLGDDRFKTCWPQTQLAFLAMAASKCEKPAMAVPVVSYSSARHAENTVYTSFHLAESGYFSLFNLACDLRPYIGEGAFRAACDHVFSLRRFFAEYAKPMLLTSALSDLPEDTREFRNRATRIMRRATARTFLPLAALWLYAWTPRTLKRASVFGYAKLRWRGRAEDVIADWSREYSLDRRVASRDGQCGVPRAHTPRDLD